VAIGARKGVDEGERRQLARGKRAAAVEAEPAEPQQACTEQHEGHAVRQDRLPAIVLARSERDRRNEGRHAGVDVHHRAPREIEHPLRHQPSAAPHPVRHRRVDEQRPQHDERDVRSEAHPLHDGPRDERGRDDGEGALVRHEEQVRDGALGLEAHSREPHVREPTIQAFPSAKARL
jgi:hypothetical protein